MSPEPAAPPVVSSARTTVVPTAITRPPAARVSAIARAVSSDTAKRSASSTWSSGRSQRIGLKVPGPTCRVTRAMRSRAASDSLKWSDAVGAATAPGSRAKIVW